METLREGQTGEHVVLLKQALHAQSFFDGDLTNDHFDEHTHSSVVQFQTHCGLPADGVVGDDTWAMLNVQDGALSTFDHHSANNDQTVDFADGSTLTGVDSSVAANATNEATDRLTYFYNEIVTAATEFYQHASAEAQALEGHSNVPLAPILEVGGHAIGVLFPELEGMHLVAAIIESIVSLEVSGAEQADENVVDHARERATALAELIYTKVTHGAHAGLEASHGRLVPHLQETLEVHPELTSGVASHDQQSIEHLLAYAGIHDLSQYSPYNRVLEQLMQTWGVAIAQIRDSTATFAPGQAEVVRDELDSAAREHSWAVRQENIRRTGDAATPDQTIVP